MKKTITSSSSVARRCVPYSVGSENAPVWANASAWPSQSGMLSLRSGFVFTWSDLDPCRPEDLALNWDVAVKFKF